MKTYLPDVFVLTITVLATAAPVVAALSLAAWQSQNDANAQVLSMAGEVLRRSNETSDQIQTAVHRLQQQAAADPCGPAALELMRNIDINSSYLQAVGYIADNHLVCSSQGLHGLARPVGPPDYISNIDFAVRTSVSFPSNPEHHFLISEQNGFAAVVHRELAFDVFVDQTDVSIGLVAISSQKLVVNRGEFRPAWLSRLGTKPEVAFVDGPFVVGIRRSTVGDFMVYAAMSTDKLRANQAQFALRLVPIGIVIGLLLSFALRRLIRNQQSAAAQIRGALKRNEFFLHYQPIVAADSGRIVGAEALIRWRQRNGELVRPDLFIPVAEDSGLITAITERVLQLIAVDLPPVLQADPDFHVAINISAADIEAPETVNRLRELLERLNVTGKRLVVEVTERSFLNAAVANEQVARLRQLGIAVAIDDFGTGYSSLSTLQSLALDYLKIDKAFVDSVGTDAATSQVVLHIIDMAKALNLKMVAEGVETEAQAALLRQRGVQFLQGWHFGRPMTAANLLQALRR